jgi:hypothetical protein
MQRLDILVNNAGILEMGTIENTSLEQVGCFREHQLGTVRFIEHQLGIGSFREHQLGTGCFREHQLGIDTVL